MKILIGFYYAIGDFISAVPTIRQLSRNHDVYVATGHQNKGLIELVALKGVNYLYFNLFSWRSCLEPLQFARQILLLQCDTILVSPHAQDKVASWKIPLLLWLLKGFGSRALVIGPLEDRNRYLYDRVVPVSKKLPLMQREIEFCRLAGFLPYQEVDLTGIIHHQPVAEQNLIVIHPGASKPNKKWLPEYYHTLVTLLTRKGFTILFVGLSKDLQPIRALIDDSAVTWFSGTLSEVIQTILPARLVLTMDSGFSHITSALGLRHIVLIGSASVDSVRPIFKNTQVINLPRLACQPCDAHQCAMDRTYCMEIIHPQLVYDHILQRCGIDQATSQNSENNLP